MSLFSKGNILLLAAFFFAAPGLALADDGTVVTSKLYVDSTKVAISQGTGTNNANVGKTLVVNASGNLELSSAALPSNIEVTTNKLDGASGNTVAANSTDTTKYTSAKAVAQYAIQKPASASEGKVLAYGANATADSQPVAAYIKVPVAAGAPSSNTPSAFAEIWLQ